MAQWGNNDNAANVATEVTSLVNVTANTQNKDTLFGNTTADAFVTGQTVGVFAVGSDEVSAQRASGDARAAHAGWVLRTEGSGGRAGRVTYEVLQAVSGGFLNDAADDAVVPDFAVVIDTQPEAVTTNTTTNASFTVVASSVPAGDTLTYAWTLADDSAIPGGTLVSGATSPTLEIDTSVQTSNAEYKVTVSGTGGAADVVSANVALTIE